ncbi:MAG TPA: PaaI family thioesterase [Bradyrhizobium sp.]|uniref:PaaI family thioesterase n=1 Tax=Bradyrhizobium sp. TaxID=376 RepID=UPI002CD4F6F6|nr:PaaI family thioesterase [Bradyrhizobium sp.]HLZ05897.1 PaaI family thioesterase [Bradyrhizobium sp.]
MTSDDNSYDLDTVKGLNCSAPFNKWCGLDVLRAANGEAELQFAWKEDLGQYAGFLHAGLIAAALDTACGFAAVTTSGRVTASHFSMSCYEPGKGDFFSVIGRVVRAGKRQVFTQAELFGHGKGGERRLIASGEAILLKIPEQAR